jgi:hypothetical protein
MLPLTETSIETARAAAPAPPAWRRLLPVAVMVAVVGAMIVRGLARHEANVRAVRAGPTRAVEIVDGFVKDAEAFLEAGQRPDGSWAYGRSATAGLETLDPSPRVASTARILLALRAAGYAERPPFARGRAFVRAHQERLGRWIAGGTGPPAEDVEATLGALATGVILLGPEPLPAEGVRRLLRAYATPLGLYPRRLDAPAALDDGDWPAADNVALAAALPALGADAAPLVAALRRRFDQGRVPPARAIVARYLASVAAPSASALSWLLGPGPELPVPAAELDNLALGAHLNVRAEECLREEDACQDLNPVAAALIQRRHLDGSWTPAAYESSGPFTGSAFETTAVAMCGLSSYRRVLEGRVSGRLVSGEEKESLPRRR